MNSVIVSKTVTHILFSLKALSQCFVVVFLTGAALCIQLINQQNSLCMIGLQHWNGCWRSHSAPGIRNTPCAWKMSVWLSDFPGVSMAVDIRTKWWKTGFAGQKHAFVYSALVKKEEKKKPIMALDPAVGRVLMHAELIGRVGLLVLQGNYRRSEHQFYKLLFH